jgi:Xaa-Pro aminopeptidase
MNSRFGRAEYEAREEKARSLMERKGLAALFVTDPSNLYYFTGIPVFAEMSFPRPAAFVLPLADDPVLIAHEFHFAFAWDGDFREYSKVGALPIDLAQAAFEDKGCARGRVGAELGHEQHLSISHNDFALLRAALPEAEFVDAADLLWQLRMVKSEAEIATISEACAMHDAIFERVFAEARVGVTTRGVESLIRHAVIDAGADDGFAIVCIGDFEPRQAAGSSDPERVLREGDLMWVDMGLTWHGYHTDYCRAVVGGEPSARQREDWDKVQQVLLECQAAARPGLSVADLCRVQLRAAEGLGLDMSTWTARRFGHGSGLHTTEPPSLSLDDDTVLEPGMLIHIEPGRIQDDGIYVREEMVVITEAGCRALSHAPWELRGV